MDIEIGQRIGKLTVLAMRRVAKGLFKILRMGNGKRI